MADLSILIPSRNEMFLSKTVDNILENIEADTEIIIVLDGVWADPPVKDSERVRIIHHSESVGQRAATNEACKLASAKWVMKVDAHCAFDKGFDRKMLEAAEGHENWTLVPVMKNLHAFDWVCQKCGNRWYQGITPSYCHKNYEGDAKNEACDNTTDFVRDVVWRGKPSPNSTSYCFDSTPHFQYFKDYEKRPEFKRDQVSGVTETMSLQGSCFMLTKDKYWELNICDEGFGSWGSQGIEVACKTWLSGGQVMCVHSTWYAHMFRTQGGDFGFPYPLPGNQVQAAKEFAKSLFMEGKWDKQIRPLSWLLKRFWPVPGWEFIPGVTVTEEEQLTKGIIFYTDNQLNLKIAKRVQKNLKNISESLNIPIVSASLKPMDFGKNIHLPLQRGYLTMAKQILAALEASTAEVIFFCEHDVLYHPTHFDFVPSKKDVFYYNINVWKVRAEDGHALHYDCQQLSGLCAYRELLLQHYKRRVALLEAFDGTPEEFNRYVREMGFEPGTHKRSARVDDFKAESWQSASPNVDIRHDGNLTPSRWQQDQFRNKRSCQGWIEAEEVPDWGKLVLV